MATKFGFNYPWSGKLGRATDCCIYCGDSGPSFQISSHTTKCCKCRSNATPDPVLFQKMMENYNKSARAWCVSNGLDYEATVQNYLQNLGPHIQERPDPIPNAEKDYSVKLEDAKEWWKTHYKYRILSPDEPCLAGDEFFDVNLNSWQKSLNHLPSNGSWQNKQAPGKTYRRKIS